MVTKLFLPQFAIFRPGFTGLERNNFRRNFIAAQIISLVFLAWPKKYLNFATK